MNHFVQFKKKDLDGELQNALESDGIFVLDGRNTLRVMINNTAERIEQLRNVQKFDAFEIHKGDLKSSRIISGPIFITMKCKSGCKCKNHCTRCGCTVGSDNLIPWGEDTKICKQCKRELGY